MPQALNGLVTPWNNMTNLEWLDRFYSELYSLKVLDALDILCKGLNGELIHYKHYTQVVKLYTLYCKDELFDLPARSLCIQWRGGPPNNRKWYRGSLLALLVDQCLQLMLKKKSSQVCNAIRMAENFGCYQ